MLKRFLLTSLLSVLMLGGCGSRDSRGEQYERVNGLLDQKSPMSQVELLDKDGLRKLVQERNGRILLLNVWATWCQPCVAEFPDLIKLSNAYNKDRVEIVGISVDYPDEIESKVIPFLKNHNVPFKVYVAKFDKQEDFINAVNSSWNGAIPATFIYGTNGNRRFSLIGQGTYNRFKREVEKARVSN